MKEIWARWSYMGDGGSDVGNVSFLVWRLRQRKLKWWFGIFLWWFGTCFMVVQYMLYNGLIYAIWCFYMFLDMITIICLIYVLVYDLAYVLVSIFMVMLFYVPMCMDVNTVTSYVIKLHYVVWVSCHYGYVIILLCYHVVMLSWCYDDIWVGTQ